MKWAAAGGGMAKGAGELGGMPPSWLWSCLESCSRGQESAGVSWVFRSYRLALRRRVVRNHRMFFSPVLCTWRKQSKTVFQGSPKTHVHCHKVYSAYLSSFQIFITLLRETKKSMLKLRHNQNPLKVKECRWANLFVGCISHIS